MRNEFRDGDRILSLHESLISNILSRLPTKDVVRTSILSKDWKYQWISSYSVNIDEKFRYNRNNENFINLMNKLLVSSEHLRSFRLRCHRTLSRLCGPPTSPGIGYLDSTCFQTWTSAALRHNLEYLEILHSAKDIVYQYSLLNSASLKTIILGQLNGTLFVSSLNYAPKLTCLCISLLEIVNENPNSSTVTFNFPVLETLTFRSCKWLNVSSVEIYAPSLTTFESVAVNLAQDYDYSIMIVSPKLSSFSCSNGLPEKFILDGSSVVSASLFSQHEVQDNELCKTIGLRARNLLNGFMNLEQLKLSSFIAEVSRLGPPLLRHEKLTQLTLRLPGNAEQLFELLDAMPSLKFLAVNVLTWDDYDYQAMKSVPSCIVSQLEEIEFRGFGRNPPEYDLAEFFLKTARRLKKFSITGKKDPCAEHIKTVLSTFVTSSSTVEIHVRGWDNEVIW